MSAPPSAASARNASLTVDVSNVRNDHGKLRICMTRNVDEFLDCREDPKSVKVSVPAFRDAGKVEVTGLSAGEWSLLLMHDENGDGKMKKSLGMPREGFGFSNNPAIRMGPPRAEDVRFTLPAGKSVHHVRVNYIL
ncbi:DUF2141 domain-containing protein [Sphingomicrobium sp. XHP0235]|uniref:DUF2141 domain-containing protein n=1 Tax=Sphingomicrobium aquimarinum TaxID=3133971 RepID=UPI0031FF2656